MYDLDTDFNRDQDSNCFFLSRANDYLLPKVVQQHDVDIHVIQIIAIWGILLTGPEVRVKAFVRKHMATMFGFIINTIKASHL